MSPLSTLPIGVVAQIIVFLLLRRYTRIGGKTAGVVIGLLAIVLFSVYAALRGDGGDVWGLHIAAFLVAAFILGLLAAHREKGHGRGFHWGPAGIIIFFLIVMVVDGVFVGIATQGLPPSWVKYVLPKPDASGEVVRSDFPGLVSRNYQKKESLYDAYLAQVAAQRKRGWQVHKGWLGNPETGRPTPFEVKVLDKQGRPVSGARVHGVFERPSNASEDHPFELKEQSPGVYRAMITLPAPGIWDLTLKIQRGDDLHEIKATTSVEAAGADSGAAQGGHA